MKYTECQKCHSPKVTWKAQQKPLCHRCATMKHGESFSKLYRAYAVHKSRGHTNLSYEQFKALYGQIYASGCVLEFKDGELRPTKKSDAIRSAKRKSNQTGYTGVYFARNTDKYYWQLMYRGERFSSKWFETAEEAARARDEFIRSEGIKAVLNFPSQPAC